MVLPPLTFIVNPSMNVRRGSTILRTQGVPKNYNYTLEVHWCYFSIGKFFLGFSTKNNECTPKKVKSE